MRIGPNDCDYFLPPVEPRLGQAFVIFGTRTGSPGTIAVSRCLGSAPLADKTVEVQELRTRAR
jgi:hypothetical protein